MTRFLLLAALATTLASTAAEPVRFAPTSRIWLEGDSTLHPYHANASQWTVTGFAGAAGPERIVVELPVRGLKSGEGALDDNLYKALKAESFPTIRFEAPRGSLKGTTVALPGTLTVAGESKPTTVHAEATQANGHWLVKGTTDLLMSDFGVKPPVLLGGLIRCTDKVVVHFELKN